MDMMSFFTLFDLVLVCLFLFILLVFVFLLLVLVFWVGRYFRAKTVVLLQGVRDDVLKEQKKTL